MKKVNIWVVWAGVVGSEVIRIIESSKDEIANKVWIYLNVTSAYTRNPKWDKSIDLYENNSELFKWSVNEIYEDNDIQLIVETLGWLNLAKEVIVNSLNNWKSVVTANKDLIATDGQELLNLADENWVALKYEASVAWWIPIINALQNWVIWDEITEIRWIMNWTCNYMLTELEKWWSYESMLKKAQELWYAESNPTNDVEWFDTAYKLAILLSVWFWKYISLDDININWISKLTEVEFKYAKLLEKKIKLLGVISSTRNKIWAYVSPVLLDNNSKIAKTDWVFNAIELVWKNASTFYSWPWAWWKATASAIISDIINISKLTQNWKYLFPNNSQSFSNYELIDKQDIESKFYCRFYIKDQKWILSKITWVFAKYDINIDQVLQHSHTHDEKNDLPFVITLEDTKQSNLDNAIKEIDNFDFINQPTFTMKILD